MLAGAILGPDRHTAGNSGEAAILLDALESVLDSSTPERQCAATVQASGGSELGQAAWRPSHQSLTQQQLAGAETVLRTTLSSLMQALLALLEAGAGACKAACHLVAEFLQERWLQLAAAGPHVVQSTLLVRIRVLHVIMLDAAGCACCARQPYLIIRPLLTCSNLVHKSCRCGRKQTKAAFTAVLYSMLCASASVLQMCSL